MSIAAHFDLALARRYNTPGPRYTSYPTANHFHTQFGNAEYAENITQSNQDLIPRPLSLYVHVPFCESPCFYCGCTRIITHDHHRGERYLLALEHEIALQAALFDADRRVTQIHLGGGTPTFLNDAQLEHLLRSMRTRFNVATAAELECAIEVDPRTVGTARIYKLRELGFNRISLGIQDFDPQVQQAVNREQSVEHTALLIQSARLAGFASINVDLIYGLPKQTLTGFAQTLAQVIELRPNRIAAYSYAHLPELFRAQTQIRAQDLPDPESKLALLAQTVELLTQAGYVYIGMDHFALPFDELARAADKGGLRRNFQGYSTQAECDIVGLGMSSIGAVYQCYAQNHKTLPEYYASIDAGKLAIARGIQLSPEDLLRRAVIERLLCQGRIDYDWFEAQFEQGFSKHFADEMQQLSRFVDDGIVRKLPRALELTPAGRFLMRGPAMCFDTYLGKTGAIQANSRFSKLI